MMMHTLIQRMILFINGTMTDGPLRMAVMYRPILAGHS